MGVVAALGIAVLVLHGLQFVLLLAVGLGCWRPKKEKTDARL